MCTLETGMQGMEEGLSDTVMSAEIDEVESLLEKEDDCTDVEEDTVEDPKPGMLFPSVDEMFEYYKNFGKQRGFPVKRRTSKRGDDGKIKYVTFTCGRSGKSKSNASNPLKPYPNMKTECKARLHGCLDDDGKNWRINSLNVEHNHGLSPSKARFFRCNRDIPSTVKRQLVVNDKAGIRVNKNFNSFVVGAGTHENLSFLETDARNYIDKQRRLRLGEGDANAIQKYFMKMQAENSGFFYSIDLDGKGRLRNVFWADSRSREAYKEFCDVITFDTTYLTNKYDMPFAPFVGVNHHGQSTLFGCGLISSEDTETFAWLFKTWLACMNDKVPPAIITDQDRAMKKAIEIVFPDSRHRWCLWHIMKKLPQKLGRYEKYHAISYDLQGVVYDSQTQAEFEERWSELFEKYNLHNDDWLSGLYDERHRWVPCFVKDSFWAGMSTTQRSESINAFFDGYVNAKTTLKQFVEQYGNALKSKVEKETQADSDSFSKKIPCATIFDMEKQLQGIYTMAIFKEFQKELTGKMYCELTSIRDDEIASEYNVQEDVLIGESKRRMIYRVSLQKDECEVKCSCLKFEFRGIPCRHAIAVLIRNDVLLLPEKYILQRWRADVRRSHTRVNVYHDGWNVTAEQMRYNKLCNAFNEVADLASLDEENFKEMMKLIDNTKKELSIKRAKCGSNEELTSKSTVPKTSDKESLAENVDDTTNILDPIATRQKGRPPSRPFKAKIPTGRRNKDVVDAQPKDIPKRKRQKKNDIEEVDLSPDMPKKRRQTKAKTQVDTQPKDSPTFDPSPDMPKKRRQTKGKTQVDTPPKDSPTIDPSQDMPKKRRETKNKIQVDALCVMISTQESIGNAIPTEESIGNAFPTPESIDYKQSQLGSSN